MKLVRKPAADWRSWHLLLSIGVCLLLMSTGATTTANAEEPCAACHDEAIETFEASAHGAYFGDGSQQANGCKSCHGDGAQHMESGGEAQEIINPARTDDPEGEKLCLSCHSGHSFDDWAFTGHSAAGVTCTNCHLVHAENGNRKSSPELCYDCHSEVRAASYMPSHHPIAEGKITCQDCHGLHGQKSVFALDDDGRELCFGCHADKEGPFMFEHAPVNEDCSICHTAHGSVADNLLKQAEPALCLSCHPMHFHATVEGIEGAFTPPQATDRSGVSTFDAWKPAMLAKCTQCHAAIHGTDMPSQTISTGGNALTR